MIVGKDLHILDYVLLGLGVFVSLATGMYYAYKERKELSTFRFHRGGGKMKALPVALSMVVTFESSIFYIGYPAEIYVHGFIYWLANIGMALGYSAMYWLSIPLFYPLQITSVYEYLQMRHGSLIIRQVAMVMSTVYMILYGAIVVYGAAIALQSVTGVHIWINILALTGIAVLYTSLGGIKAVVATDVVQGIMMTVIIIAVLIYGTIYVGGVRSVFDYNRPSGRLQLVDFDPSPFTRHTFWTLIVGNFFSHVGYACRQPVVQRLNSTKSITEAKKVAVISNIGFIILQMLVMTEGLVLYAYFSHKGCDPLASGEITNPNEIISFAVMDMFSRAPGVTGLFLAALCSASLSTVSSLLSSVSAVVSEDVLRQRWKHASDATLTKASKVIVLISGIVCAGVGLAISQAKGPMTQISGSLLGSIGGPVTSLFLMSIFIKWSTKKGILISTFCGVLFALWLSLGYNFSTGRKTTPWLPLGPTDKCYNRTNFLSSNYSVTYMDVTVNTLNITGSQSMPEESPEIKGLDKLYSISYLYFSVLVTIFTITIGLLVSLVTKVERQLPIPKYLMLSLNKRFFKCQPNFEDSPGQTDMAMTVVNKSLIQEQNNK